MKCRYFLLLLYISSSYSLEKQKYLKHESNEPETDYQYFYQVTEMITDNNYEPFVNEVFSRNGIDKVFREEVRPRDHDIVELTEAVKKPKPKSHKKNKIRIKKRIFTTPSPHYPITQAIDRKYFHKDPILNEVRRKFMYELSDDVDPYTNMPNQEDIPYTAENSEELLFKHLEGKWGENCNQQTKSMCVLPIQCTQEFETLEGNHLCEKGTMKMICCDFHKYVLKVLMEHEDLTGWSDYLDDDTVKKKLLQKLPKARSLFKTEIKDNLMNTGNINLNEALRVLQVHELGVTKSNLQNIRLQNEDVSLYFPNSELFWRLKWARREIEDKNITYYSNKDEFKKILTDSNNTNELYFRSHLPKLMRYLKRKNRFKSNSSSNSDAFKYDAQRIYSEDTDDPRFSLGLDSDNDSIDKLDSTHSAWLKNWGMICSNKPGSICVIRGQCNKKGRNRKGNQLCKKASKNLICCDVYTVWKKLFVNSKNVDNTPVASDTFIDGKVKCSNNPPSVCQFKSKCHRKDFQPQGHHFCQKDNKDMVCCKYGRITAINKYWGETCSHKPASVCVLPNQCVEKYKAPQGHHFCDKYSVKMICCNIFYIWNINHKNSTQVTLGNWGKRCLKNPDSICVMRIECTKKFKTPKGDHMCKNQNQDLICCDYIKLLWTELIENGKYPVANVQNQDKWGLRCSNNPPSICVFKTQCSKSYLNPKGDHFCQNDQKLICCDFISHLYDHLVLGGKWSKIPRSKFVKYIYNMIKSEIDDPDSNNAEEHEHEMISGYGSFEV